MDIFDWYRQKDFSELQDTFSFAANEHPSGLAPGFIEKDVWVTELLRLLFDEGLLEGKAVAFKGGTALSKRWGAIERFSEDIDLSIHWHDILGGDKSEDEAWTATNKSKSQVKKFRQEQAKRLDVWTEQFAQRLEARLAAYDIEGLTLNRLNAEQIEVHYPIATEGTGNYHLGPVLLEFGARNRGKPTQPSKIGCYLGDVPALADALTLPIAENVMVFDPHYILWEKLTALHQFCTSEKQPDAARLARHWYDVDCMMEHKVAEPLGDAQAIQDVIEMKAARWSTKGVDFHLASTGALRLIPDEPLASEIKKDFDKMVESGMYFNTPDNFECILERLGTLESTINNALARPE